MTEAVRPAVRAAAVMLVILVTGCSHLPRSVGRGAINPHRRRRKSMSCSSPAQTVPRRPSRSIGGAIPCWWICAARAAREYKTETRRGDCLAGTARPQSHPRRHGYSGGARRSAHSATDHPQGSNPIDLDLAPGIYTPRTAQITVSWGPNTTAAP